MRFKEAKSFQTTKILADQVCITFKNESNGKEVEKPQTDCNISYFRPSQTSVEL
jgi:hypothetical protein